MDKLITNDYPDKSNHSYELRALNDIPIPPGQMEKVSTGVTAFMSGEERFVLETPDTLMERGIFVVFKTVNNKYYETKREIEVYLYNTTQEYCIINKFDLIAIGTFFEII